MKDVIADSALGTNVNGLQYTYDQIIATSSGSAWNICVTATGNKSQLLLSLPSVTFTDQQIATLVLTHTPGGVLLNGMILNQQGSLATYPNTLARVRFVADAASAAVVSATMGGTTLSSGVTSPNVGAYQAVTAGAVTTALQIGGVALADPGLTLAAGNDYTLLVAGTAANGTVKLFTDDNTPSTNTSLPVSMRLINGINGLEPTASLTSDGVDVADSVSFAAASAYQDIASATNTADLEAASGTASLWSFTTATLASGSVYTVFLLGDYTPGNTPPVVPYLRQDRAPISAATSGAATVSN